MSLLALLVPSILIPVSSLFLDSSGLVGVYEQ
jgi:hypothetical protein